MDPLLEETLKLFVEEAREGLVVFEKTLKALSQADESERSALVNKALRVVHTIKGSAGYFGLTRIDELSHTMESVLGMVRDGNLELGREETSVLLDGADKLLEMIETMPDDTVNISQCIASLLRIIKTPHLHPEDEKESFDLSDEIVLKARSNGRYIFRLDLTEDGGPAVAKIKKDIETLGDFIDEPENGIILFSTVLEEDLVTQALLISKDSITLLFDPSSANSRSFPKTASTKSPQESISVADLVSSAPSTIRVGVGLLEDLMNLAGELVLARNQLTTRLEAAVADDALLGGLLQQLSSVSASLREKITETRLQPVDTLFCKLPRIVRDLSIRLGKDVELDFEGGLVELDKTVLESISVPLVHLVRNALDHGIETPAERESLGKPACGRLSIEAQHVGEFVVINISDDGRGIDATEIFETAQKKGIIDEAERSSLGFKDAVALLLSPGFSTRSEVTSISGRGVGLDVVKADIERLGGSVMVSSEPGRGTTFSLRLPLTLAIVSAVIVKECGHYFVVLQKQLYRIERVPVRDRLKRILTVKGTPALRVPDGLLPLIRLSDILGIERSFITEDGGISRDRRVAISDRRAKEIYNSSTVCVYSGTERRENKADRRDADNDIIRVLVMEYQSNRFGLVVDSVIDSEEIIVKPLPPQLMSCRLYSGTTILGGGQLAAILDAVGLVRKAGLSFSVFREVYEPGSEESSTQGEDAVGRQRYYILFDTGEDGLYAVHVNDIEKIERCDAADIQLRAGLELIERQGRCLRLLRLEQKSGSELPSKPYIIIPRAKDTPRFGLLAHRIVDTVELESFSDLLDASVTGEKFVGASFVHNGNIVFVPDMDNIAKSLEFPEGDT